MYVAVDVKKGRGRLPMYVAVDVNKVGAGPVADVRCS